MDTRKQLDLVTFEVLRHRLWEINDEMGVMAGRISGSPAVYESGDFNSALLTADGRGLFTGVYVIRQSAALDVMVQSVIRSFEGDVEEGDMFLTNDPWYGALHAMDYAVVAPVFWEGRCVAWTGVVMHEMDVGGPRPGSWSVGARNVYEECPLMPPIKIVSGGRFRKDVESAYLRNSRTAQINALNLRAKISSQSTTHERLKEIIREYGLTTFLSLQEQIIEYVSRSVRKRVARLPDGVFQATCLLQHDGVNDRLYELKLKLSKTGDRLKFDFTGTAKQAGGAINCAYSGLIGGVTQVLFPLLCFDLPWSQGALLGCIDIISERGTINNCDFPAATSMATVNASQATGNLVWEAMAKLYAFSEELKEEVIALGYGGVNMAVLAGKHADGAPFVNMFTDSVGGGGARSFADGIDTCGNVIAPSYGIPNVERIESLFPVLYLYRKEKPDTAGAGKYRGGVGLEYMITPYGTTYDIEAIFFASGCDHPENKGVWGGLPGTVQRNVLLRNTNLEEMLRNGQIPDCAESLKCERIDMPLAKDTASLKPGDIWVNYCSGGGGYGDPLLRDPLRVQRDVRIGLCSAALAETLYGVSLDRNLAVDADKTARIREARRCARVKTGKRHAEAIGNGMEQSTGEKLLRCGDMLAIYQSAQGPVYRCESCRHVLGQATDDLRQLLLLNEQPIGELAPVNAQVARPQVVVRQYCCPSCGTLLSADVPLKSYDPWMPDMQLAKLA
jgi:N-methylhydantoinase B/oxoprolinase/acetone carboxylase alpha subunit